MEVYEILWKKVLEELEKTTAPLAYETFITRLTPVDVNGTKLVLSIQTETLANTIASKFLDKIKDAISNAKIGVTDIELHIGNSKEDFLAANGYSACDVEIESMPINPKYTFDSFVVGNSNKFLYNAAKYVAGASGTSDTYNPLFIYGNSGLGKTHIMHAIANELMKNNPELHILYATCEKFTNDLIATIRQGRGEGQNFRNKYRNVDVLMIDDIQFLAKKQSTQEEFFHTFNELYGQNKQIILSADCQPSEIELLGERLRTRFESGLLAQVLPPDLETKIAILQKKAEEKKYILGFDVAQYIAEHSDNNVRSLEGLLNKVIFASMLKEEPITVALAQEAIKESSTTEQTEATTVDTVINAVCSFYKIKPADLTGKKKNKEIVEPRQICIYLICELVSVPLMTIGKALGGRDHTTSMHARNKIAAEIKINQKVSTQVNDLKNLILKK